jgi:AbrB family looped-hinge helix DNA binding protein
VKSTITERGQVSIPAELRREMQLSPGQTLIWEQVSPTECRVVVAPKAKIKPDPLAALRFAEEHGLETMRTDDWMKILREGEQD